MDNLLLMLKFRMFTLLLAMGLALALIVSWVPDTREFALIIWTGACAMYRGEEPTGSGEESAGPSRGSG